MSWVWDKIEQAVFVAFQEELLKETNDSLNATRYSLKRLEKKIAEQDKQIKKIINGVENTLQKTIERGSEWEQDGKDFRRWLHEVDARLDKIETGISTKVTKDGF